jgi:hypothetical protein
MKETPVSESDLLAIAAHLHVQMRRHAGRVTDVEWMVHDRDYAAAMISLSKSEAVTRGVPEMAIWAQRFERALARVQRPHRPLLSALASRSAQEERQASLPVAMQDSQFSQSLYSEFSDSVVTEFGDAGRMVDTSRLTTPPPAPPERYVWSLR